MSHVLYHFNKVVVLSDMQAEYLGVNNIAVFNLSKKKFEYIFQEHS